MFAALEGIDGSGKGTQIELLKKYFGSGSRDVHFTCEPSGFGFGKMIRNCLSGSVKTDNAVIAALFVADRLEHILDKNDGLLKLLSDGKDVITDRYYFSSYAYQSVDIPMDLIIRANSYAAELLKPDVTVFIDVPPDEAMRRITASRAETELFETMDRLKRTREKYFEAFEKLRETENIVIVDGCTPPEDINKEIIKILEKFF